MTTNFFKTAFWVLLIVFAVAIGYWYYTKPEVIELSRDAGLQTQIDHATEMLIAKDSLLNIYADSLQQAENNVKIITKTVYREQQQIIQQPPDTGIGKYFADFYDLKLHEIGITPPPLGDVKLTLNAKEIKGGELLISDYKGVKSVNSELNKQVDYLTETGNLKQQKITALNDIVSAKEKQIVKLEKTKIPVVNSRSFWVDLGIISGSLAVGAIIGIVYANNR